MKFEEVTEWHRHEYKENCCCGKTLIVLTQEDKWPEYQTSVYVRCECGDYVNFCLPVN